MANLPVDAPTVMVAALRAAGIVADVGLASLDLAAYPGSVTVQPASLQKLADPILAALDFSAAAQRQREKDVSMGNLKSDRILTALLAEVNELRVKVGLSLKSVDDVVRG